MTDDPASPPPSRPAASQGRRFKRHELALEGGARLVLNVDGSIVRLDESGSATATWAPDDPAWPDQAIRFGLHPQTQTIAPRYRSDRQGAPRS